MKTFSLKQIFAAGLLTLAPVTAIAGDPPVNPPRQSIIKADADGHINYKPGPLQSDHRAAHDWRPILAGGAAAILLILGSLGMARDLGLVRVQKDKDGGPQLKI